MRNLPALKSLGRIHRI